MNQFYALFSTLTHLKGAICDMFAYIEFQSHYKIFVENNSEFTLENIHCRNLMKALYSTK